MGRKRKYKKNKMKLNSKERTFLGEIAGGLVIVLAIALLIFLNFSDAGVISKVVNYAFKSLFGAASYIVPIVMMIIGSRMIVSEDKVYFWKEFLKGIVVTMFLSITICTFSFSNTAMFSNFVRFITETIKGSVADEVKYGLFGGIFGSILIKFTGTVVSRIFAIVTTFLFSLLFLDVSLQQFGVGIYNGFVFVVNSIYNILCKIFKKEDDLEVRKIEVKRPQRRVEEQNIPIQRNGQRIEEKPKNKKEEKKVQKRGVYNLGLDDDAFASQNYDADASLGMDEYQEQALKQAEIDAKMEEATSPNVMEFMKKNALEQVAFDFDKLSKDNNSSQNISSTMSNNSISSEGTNNTSNDDSLYKTEIAEKQEDKSKEVLTIDHTMLEQEEAYEFPPIDILGINKDAEKNVDRRAIHAVAVKLQKTLSSFGVEAKVINITRGPTVTRYELSPNTGVKVSKIVNLTDDIALNLAAETIRIEAPIPGKAAVGIEVPNEEPESVFIREVIESSNFKTHPSSIAVALGKDAAGDTVVADLAKMPHVLIAGATGSGKSVCINSIITSLIYKSKPSDVKLILIDPKMVELSVYNGIPHLLIPVVTEPKRAAGALNWAVQEMQKRYSLFAANGVKDIKGYNAHMEKEGSGAKLPKIVIIIDELADLMMVAPNDVEDAICRLAQMARAAGMHLVIATQRPSVDVITGIIKANIPSRIAFTVSSNTDSRTILDMGGAEKLLGKGDMLYFPVGATKPQRIQGTWVSESEVENVVNCIKKDAVVVYNNDVIQSIEKVQLKADKGSGSAKDPDDIENPPPGEDPRLMEAIDLVMDMGQASASMLQRKLQVGYSRAGRMIDQMEERGIVSGYDGAKPRQLLITKSQWQEEKFKLEHPEEAANAASSANNNNMNGYNASCDMPSNMNNNYNMAGNITSNYGE